MNSFEEQNSEYRRSNRFKNFTNLTKHFDLVLKANDIKKEDEEAIKYLYYNILSHMQYENIQGDIEKLIIEAALEYEKEHISDSSIIKVDFSDPNITRKEATFLVKKNINEKYNIYDTFYKYQSYQKQLIINLIEYVYYEHDFSKIKEEQIEASKSSKK